MPALPIAGATARELRTAAAFLVAYGLTAYAGFHLAPVHGFATLLWPPSGIALAALFLFGTRYFSFILIGAFVVNLTVGASVPAALAIACGNTLEAVLGAELLRKVGFNPHFTRLKDALALIAVGIGIPFVSATVGVATLALDGALLSGQASGTWGVWWLGDAVSALTIAPVLFAWIPNLTLPKAHFERLEWLGVFVASFLIGLLIFWSPYDSAAGIPLIYLVLLPLVWGALRIGPRGVTLLIFFTKGVAVAGMFYSGKAIATDVLPLQIFFGILAAILLLFTAIAEERRLSAATLERHVEHLEHALARIKAEDEAKTNFVAVLAHELRNPLAPLLSSLELMRLKGPIDEKSKELVNSMRGRVRTMARLLDDLLDISRISHHKLSITKEKVELNRIVERAVETTAPNIKRENHALSVTLPPRPVEFLGDPVRLEQIVVNLLTNAAKYTEPGGKISLSLTVHRSQAVIRVKDTGIGIAPTFLARIFEPFAQGEGARQAGQGLGLGLALSRSLVEMHGGTIEARSGGPGKGSEFIVRLPLSESPLAGRRAERARQLKFMSPLGSELRIFITDDNEAAADTLAELLRHLGHAVETAYTGGEALRKISEFNPQVVILDIGLPDMDGYAVARALKERGTLATLIALTGYGQDDDKERSREAGFEYHLVKPVGIADLEALLKKLTPKL